MPRDMVPERGGIIRISLSPFFVETFSKQKKKEETNYNLIV